jgi:hypothetical protein
MLDFLLGFLTLEDDFTTHTEYLNANVTDVNSSFQAQLKLINHKTHINALKDSDSNDRNSFCPDKTD